MESQERSRVEMCTELPLCYRMSSEVHFPSSSIKLPRGWNDLPLTLAHPCLCVLIATGAMYWIATIWGIHQISPFSLIKCWKSDLSCCQLSVSYVVWNRFFLSELLKLTVFGTAPRWSQIKIFYEMVQTSTLQRAAPVMSRALFCLFILVHHTFTPFHESPCIHVTWLLHEYKFKYWCSIF